MEDFSAALAFIRDDDHVVNEFFLKGFEPRGDGYVFWFGYIIENYPILMPEGWPVSSPEDILPAPIEAVVEQGRVVFYRRLAHNFHADDTHNWLTDNALNLEELLYGREFPILSLGYPMRLADSLRLEWLAMHSEDE